MTTDLKSDLENFKVLYFYTLIWMVAGGVILIFCLVYSKLVQSYFVFTFLAGAWLGLIYTFSRSGQYMDIKRILANEQTLKRQANFMTFLLNNATKGEGLLISNLAMYLRLNTDLLPSIKSLLPDRIRSGLITTYKELIGYLLSQEGKAATEKQNKRNRENLIKLQRLVKQLK